MFLIMLCLLISLPWSHYSLHRWYDYHGWWSNSHPVYQAFASVAVWDEGSWSSLVFLGIEVACGSRGYLLFQQKYTVDLVSYADLSDDATLDALMQLNLKLTPAMDEPLANPTRYRELVGALLSSISLSQGWTSHMSLYLHHVEVRYYGIYIWNIFHLRDLKMHYLLCTFDISQWISLDKNFVFSSFQINISLNMNYESNSYLNWNWDTDANSSLLNQMIHIRKRLAKHVSWFFQGPTSVHYDALLWIVCYLHAPLPMLFSFHLALHWSFKFILMSIGLETPLLIVITTDYCVFKLILVSW